MVALACVVTLALAGCDAIPAPLGSTTAPTPPPTPVEQHVLASINSLRASHHLPALKVNPNLEDKARLWSAWMAGGGCGTAICHSRLASGIKPGWTMLAENVGAARPKSNIDGVINGFTQSPGHLANILNATVKFVGVGVAYSGNTVFVTEEFMAR